MFHGLYPWNKQQRIFPIFLQVLGNLWVMILPRVGAAVPNVELVITETLTALTLW